MLENSIIIALAVLFIYSCFLEGMIFDNITKSLWNSPVWLKKPLFDCPICMVPWYGTIICLLLGIHKLGVGIMIVTLLCAGGINFIISTFLKEE